MIIKVYGDKAKKLCDDLGLIQSVPRGFLVKLSLHYVEGRAVVEIEI